MTLRSDCSLSSIFGQYSWIFGTRLCHLVQWLILPPLAVRQARGGGQVICRGGLLRTCPRCSGVATAPAWRVSRCLAHSSISPTTRNGPRRHPPCRATGAGRRLRRTPLPTRSRDVRSARRLSSAPAQKQRPVERAQRVAEHRETLTFPPVVAQGIREYFDDQRRGFGRTLDYADRENTRAQRRDYDYSAASYRSSPMRFPLAR